MDNAKRAEMTRLRLLEHFNTYPALQTEDVFKYLFQSAFGCEHLVASEEAVLTYIQREYQTVSAAASSAVEPLDGEYSRVPLSCLHTGLSPKTLARLFCLSAKEEADGKASLEQKIEVAKELVAEDALPLDRDEFMQKLAAWQALGYPAMHHSNAFRSAYKPAYRVIANRYAQLLPLFAQAGAMKKIIVIGCPGAGKTTFAKQLYEKTGLPLFHLDAIWHKPDKTHISREEYDARLSDILATDSWIIDGNYSRTLEGRIAACDTVFLLDMPVDVCLAGATSRLGTERCDMPWIDTKLDLKLRKEIEEFPLKNLPIIYALIDKYRHGKTVAVFKCRECTNAFLNGLVL